MASLQDLFLGAQHLRASTYTCAAAVTILLYDMILTMPAEIALIWPARFSLVKVLYFMNRYLPLPCILLGVYHLAHFRPKPLTLQFCKITVLSQLISQAICLIASTWLLVLRVTALYSNSPLVKIGLYIVWIITQVVAIAMATIVTVKTFPKIEYNVYTDICTSDPPAVILGTLYFSPVACEVALIVLQMYHHYHHFSTINPIQVFNRSRCRSLPPRVPLSKATGSGPDLQFPSSFIQPLTPQGRTSFGLQGSSAIGHTSTELDNLAPSSSPTAVAFSKSPGSPVSVSSPTSPVTVTGAHAVSQSLTRPNYASKELQPEMRRATPLLRTLYMDGLIYFVVVVALRLWSFFIFTFADVSLWYLSTYLEFSLVSTSVSRLVLHLRGAATEKDSFVNPETEEWDDMDTGFSIDADPMNRRRMDTYATSNYDTSNYALSMEAQPQPTRRHGKGRSSRRMTGGSGMDVTRSIGRSLATMSRTSFRGMGSVNGTATGTWMSLDDVDIPSGAISPEVNVPPDVLRRAGGVISPFSAASRDEGPGSDALDHFYGHSHTRSNSDNRNTTFPPNQPHAHSHTPSHDSAKERFVERMRSPSRLCPLPESPSDPHASFAAHQNTIPRSASRSGFQIAPSGESVESARQMVSLDLMRPLRPMSSKDSIGSIGFTPPVIDSDAMEMRSLHSHHFMHSGGSAEGGGSHRRGMGSKSSHGSRNTGGKGSMQMAGMMDASQSQDGHRIRDRGEQVDDGRDDIGKVVADSTTLHGIG